MLFKPTDNGRKEMVTSSKNKQWVPSSWHRTRYITSLGGVEDQDLKNKVRFIEKSYLSTFH